MIKQRNITLIVVHCTASRCTSNLTPEPSTPCTNAKALPNVAITITSPKMERYITCVTSPMSAPTPKATTPRR